MSKLPAFQRRAPDTHGTWLQEAQGFHLLFGAGVVSWSEHRVGSHPKEERKGPQQVPLGGKCDLYEVVVCLYVFCW